ncbi:GFA family protein, partial [Siccirubricoccus deserti]|nr:GFA family protein [Siccirubricoccus deserti]
MPRMMGGCLCGAVRYKVETQPIFVRACHCKECWRFTGSAFVAAVAILKNAIPTMRAMQTYTQPGGTSGLALHRQFCPGAARPSSCRLRARRGWCSCRSGVGTRSADDPLRRLPGGWLEPWPWCLPDDRAGRPRRWREG